MRRDDNHCLSNTILYRGASQNTLLVNDSAFGTFILGNDISGNRIGANYATASGQPNIAPGPLYCSPSGGPSALFAGIYVQLGQIVFDTTPAAGGKIGWVALTAGDGATVTWKPFGAIDA